MTTINDLKTKLKNLTKKWFYLKEETDSLIDSKVPQSSSTTPLADTSTGTPGANSNYSRADHRHPKSSLYAESTHSHDEYINSTIADNLTTNDATQVLSAKQGKILNDNKSDINHVHSEYLTSHQSLSDIGGTVTVEKQTTAESGYVATYIVKQNNTQVGSKINIPKDYLVKSAQLSTVTSSNMSSLGSGFAIGDKYIDFIINVQDNSETDEHLYLNVKDLIDTYTADESTLTLNNGQFSIKRGVIPIAGVSAPSADTTNGYIGESTNYAREDHIHPKSSLYVEKETGKGLSSNDFTNVYKNQLDELDDNYIQKSLISGLIQNDGNVDTNVYIIEKDYAINKYIDESSILDISMSEALMVNDIPEQAWLNNNSFEQLCNAGNISPNDFFSELYSEGIDYNNGFNLIRDDVWSEEEQYYVIKAELSNEPAFIYYGLSNSRILREVAFTGSYDDLIYKPNLNVYEKTINKTSSWNTSPNNIRYPTEKLVKDSLDLKANTLDIPTDINDLNDSFGLIPIRTSDLQNDSNFISTNNTPGLIKNDGTIDTTTYSTFNGNYNDLTNKPNIPVASSTTPIADIQNGNIGSATTFAKADHQHPLSSAYASATHFHNIEDISSASELLGITLWSDDGTYVSMLNDYLIYDVIEDKICYRESSTGNDEIATKGDIEDAIGNAIIYINQ